MVRYQSLSDIIVYVVIEMSGVQASLLYQIGSRTADLRNQPCKVEWVRYESRVCNKLASYRNKMYLNIVAEESSRWLWWKINVEMNYKQSMHTNNRRWSQSKNVFICVIINNLEISFGWVEFLFLNDISTYEGHLMP